MADDRWRDEDRNRWDEDRYRYGRPNQGGAWYGPDRYRNEYDRPEWWYGGGSGYGNARYGDREREREMDRERYNYGDDVNRRYGRRGYSQDYRAIPEYNRPDDRSEYYAYGIGWDIYGAPYYGQQDGRLGRGFDRDRDWDTREGRYANPWERGWWDRTKDEVRSWMGDEEAERRRRADLARSGHYGRGPRGYTRSDERIREDVNDRLTDDWRVDASDIEVTVTSGEVTLSGTVDSRDAKRRAEDLADHVSGVRHVQNNLRVRQQTTGIGTSESLGATPGTTTGTSTTTRPRH